MGPPKFKRKTSRQAVRFTKAARFSLTADRMLRLPKIGDVQVRWSRELPCNPSSVTVIKDAAGRYFCSFVVEAEDKPLPELDVEETDTGIDLGLSSYAGASLWTAGRPWKRSQGPCYGWSGSW